LLGKQGRSYNISLDGQRNERRFSGDTHSGLNREVKFKKMQKVESKVYIPSIIIICYHCFAAMEMVGINGI
jgi:hypothetical protein